jgi:regulator of nucleoside diphosphate kinase
MNREDSICIAEPDHNRFSELPATPSSTAEQEYAYADRSESVPHDVVTMNSTVVYEDEAIGEQRTITIVHPHHADIAEGRISALAPVGRALLGLSAGESIDWPFPDGKNRRLRVVDVVYQPEAARRRPSPLANDGNAVHKG